MTDFEERYYWDRRGSGCAKWDGMARGFGSGDLIAMWVADMDFRAPESVHEAMLAQVETNTYGYTFASPAYYEAFVNWEEKRHGYRAERAWMRYTPGVVCGIYRFLGAMTEPGDACIILSPCYYPFMSAVEDYLNMRTGPDTKYARIREIPAMAKVGAVSKSGNWYLVSYEDDMGWVSGEYLTSNLNYRRPSQATATPAPSTSGDLHT